MNYNQNDDLTEIRIPNEVARDLAALATYETIISAEGLLNEALMAGRRPHGPGSVDDLATRILVAGIAKQKQEIENATPCPGSAEINPQ